MVRDERPTLINFWYLRGCDLTGIPVECAPLGSRGFGCASSCWPLMKGTNMAETNARIAAALKPKNAPAKELLSDPFPEYERYDAIGLAALVRSGNATASELMEAAVVRFEARNPALNAIVVNWFDEARESARQPFPEGQFSGVPFVLKDLGSEMKGTPLGMGSRLFAGHRAEEDSEVVKRFRAAGLIPIGRGNAPEFGISGTTEPLFHGPTRNPWDLRRTPGGSSGGAAAAVAAGIVPMAYASDAGGSTRIPASCCGLVGMKPSRGHSPVVLGAALGQELVVSRTVRDTAAALDAVSKTDLGAAFAAPSLEGSSYLQQVKERPRQLRIAVSRRPPHGRPLHSDCLAAVDHAARLCRDLGHTVFDAEPEYDFSALAHAMFKVLMAARVAGTVAAREKALGRSAEPHELEPYTRAMITFARGLSALDYAAALETVNAFTQRFANFFVEYDVLLTSTLGRPPLPLGELIGSIGNEDAYLQILYGFMPFTMQFNASGMPALSLPLYWSKDGLPIGVQFGARRGDDAMLIRLAAQLEMTAPWFDRRPPVVDSVGVPHHLGHACGDRCASPQARNDQRC